MLIIKHFNFLFISYKHSSISKYKYFVKIEKWESVTKKKILIIVEKKWKKLQSYSLQ